MSESVIKEEVTVLFHAALIGRTDVLQVLKLDDGMISLFHTIPLTYTFPNPPL